MEQQEYQDLMMSKPYNGLQLVHMSYEKAYEFAGIYGMNAIIVHLNRGREMQMVRLKQTLNNKLRVANAYDIHGNMVTSYNCFTLEDPKDYDIYWIGLK